MGERVIETVGNITKKELVASVRNETYSNKLILENQEPYPGYNDTSIPDRLEPDSIFAITKLQYNDERMYRAIAAVRKAVSYDFDGAAGTLTYQNKGYNCVRFKRLPYKHVGEILSLFEKKGIEFLKARKTDAFQSIIKVRKFFSVKEIADGIYQDTDDKEITYLKIPLLLRWPTFEKITMNIKYNMDDSVWDAAQTSMYYKSGLMDFVRIYDKDSCQGKLLHIREKYLEAIAKL